MPAPAELSQGVITGPPVPAEPAARERAWDRVEALLQTARGLEVVPIPEALESAFYAAQDATGKGLPAPSLRPVKRELVRLREQVAWTMRTAGHCQAKIAHYMGISQPAVCKILRRVERRVLVQMEADVRQVKARQAAQLAYILDQAMRAWKDSQERQEGRQAHRSDPRGFGNGMTTVTNRKTAGDPRYLMVALKALAAERELWGLDRPEAPAPGDGPAITATRTESVTIRACRPTPRPEGPSGNGPLP